MEVGHYSPKREEKWPITRIAKRLDILSVKAKIECKIVFT